MTELQAMYDGQANSPSTTLTGAIDSDDTSITVADASILPAAPTWLTLGADTDEAETVLLTGKSGNDLTVTRGQDGTTAKAWAAGAKVQRCFTAGDHNALIDNIEALNIGKQEAAASFPPSAHAASHATGQADAITPANIGAEASGTAAAAVSAHASDSGAHSTQFAAKVNTSALGAANGVATLDADSKVTPAQASAQNEDITTNRTLSNADAGKHFLCKNATAITITIPALTLGTEIEVTQYAAGDVTFAASGITIVSADGALTIAGQYMSVALKMVEANVCLLVGALK